MTFGKLDKGKLKRENKRARLPGTIVQKVKKLVTTTEIGKATVTKIDTPVCDYAMKVVSEDIQECDIQNGR